MHVRMIGVGSTLRLVSATRPHLDVHWIRSSHEHDVNSSHYYREYINEETSSHIWHVAAVVSYLVHHQSNTCAVRTPKWRHLFVLGANVKLILHLLLKARHLAVVFVVTWGRA
jgi:hypothetical protein